MNPPLVNGTVSSTVTTHTGSPPPEGSLAVPFVPLEEQLFLAVRINDLPLITQLLRNPDINLNWPHPDQYMLTALHCACFYKLPEAFLLLLRDPRTEVNVLNGFQSTPLSLACFNDCLPIVQALLQDTRTQMNIPNGRAETPLWRAVQSGNVEVIKRMLAADQRVDTVTASLATSAVPLTTPAELARFKNYPELARVLEEYEVNPGKIRFQIRLLLGTPGQSYHHLSSHNKPFCQISPALIYYFSVIIFILIIYFRLFLV